MHILGLQKKLSLVSLITRSQGTNRKMTFNSDVFSRSLNYFNSSRVHRFEGFDEVIQEKKSTLPHSQTTFIIQISKVFMILIINLTIDYREPTDALLK